MVERIKILISWSVIEFFVNNIEILKIKLFMYYGEDFEISRKFYKMSIKL